MKSIVSFDIINAIYMYLCRESDNATFKMKGIHDNVIVDLYTFPDVIDNEIGWEQIKKAGFNDPHEILNEIYKKIGINVLSQEIIEQKLQYDFIHIQFYSEPTPEVKKFFKRSINNFLIFFCRTNSLEINDFRILHSGINFIDYTKELLYAKPLDINNPENESQAIGIKDFKLVLQGTCEYLNIEIPKRIELPSQENLIKAEEVNLEVFKEFINLISRGDIEEKELKKQSKKLFNNFRKGIDEYSEEYYEMVIEGHLDFFENIDGWDSDWKFSPEDVESNISEILGEDLNFNYPDETYSHELFPYIQSALEKFNLELMSYNTNGDNYVFFLANKSDVDRILELSELTKIEVAQL